MVKHQLQEEEEDKKYIIYFMISSLIPSSSKNEIILIIVCILIENSGPVLHRFAKYINLPNNLIKLLPENLTSMKFDFNFEYLIVISVTFAIVLFISIITFLFVTKLTFIRFKHLKNQNEISSLRVLLSSLISSAEKFKSSSP